MALELFKNNITTTLAVGINSAATSITVATGTGTFFPTLSGGNYFRAVLTSSAVPGSSYEYIIVTAVSGDTLTVIRGQEGVSAGNWNAGDIIYMTATAASNGNFAQSGELSAYAPIASPAFTGNPTAPTPSRYDDDTSLATTEFVTRAGLQFSSFPILTTNTVMDATYAGSQVWINSGSTFTLPLISQMPALGGGTLGISNNSIGVITVQRQASDIIWGNTFNQSLTSITLYPGDTAFFEAGPSNAIWYLIGGTAKLPWAPLFGGSFVNNGYQKLPSGLIIQWGSIVCTLANTYYTGSFPITFPNATLQLVGTFANGMMPESQPVNAQWISASQYQVACAAAAETVKCIALGY